MNRPLQKGTQVDRTEHARRHLLRRGGFLASLRVGGSGAGFWGGTAVLRLVGLLALTIAALLALGASSASAAFLGYAKAGDPVSSRVRSMGPPAREDGFMASAPDSISSFAGPPDTRPQSAGALPSRPIPSQFAPALRGLGIGLLLLALAALLAIAFASLTFGYPIGSLG